MSAPDQPVPIRSRERDFEKFCQENGVSGLLMWCDPDCSPGARPATGSQLYVAQRADAAHRVAFANGALARLADFKQWLRGLITSR